MFSLGNLNLLNLTTPIGVEIESIGPVPIVSGNCIGLLLALTYA